MEELWEGWDGVPVLGEGGGGPLTAYSSDVDFILFPLQQAEFSRPAKSFI